MNWSKFPKVNFGHCHTNSNHKVKQLKLTRKQNTATPDPSHSLPSSSNKCKCFNQNRPPKFSPKPCTRTRLNRTTSRRTQPVQKWVWRLRATQVQPEQNTTSIFNDKSRIGTYQNPSMKRRWVTRHRETPCRISSIARHSIQPWCKVAAKSVCTRLRLAIITFRCLHTKAHEQARTREAWTFPNSWVSEWRKKDRIMLSLKVWKPKQYNSAVKMIWMKAFRVSSIATKSSVWAPVALTRYWPSSNSPSLERVHNRISWWWARCTWTKVLIQEMTWEDRRHQLLWCKTSLLINICPKKHTTLSNKAIIPHQTENKD